MEGRTYLASDLAGDLGLPRSTINDWLARYADYLEVETRGKRKVYSTRSLRILKEIAEMRKEIAALSSKKKAKEVNFLDIIPGTVYRHTFADGSSAWVILKGNQFTWSCTGLDGVTHEDKANSLTGVCKAVQSVRGKGDNMNASR